jgi:hypothetical protein
MNAQLSNTVVAARAPDSSLMISVALTGCVVTLASLLIFGRDASDADLRAPQRGASEHERRAPERADASAYALVPRPRSLTAPGSLFVAPARSRAGDVPLSSELAEAAHAVAPAAVQPAIEPSLPYALIGRLRDSGRWTVLLAAGRRQEVATEGDVLDGVWRVEAIGEHGIRFEFLPLGTYQHLAFTADEPPGVGPQLVEGQGPRAASVADPAGPVAGAVARPAAPPIAGAVRATARDGSAAAQASPRDFQRRITRAEIPREPWVCEAARLNALVPCRNTWSMSEAERVACRKAADQRYNTCLSTALTAPAQEEGEDEGG